MEESPLEELSLEQIDNNLSEPSSPVFRVTSSPTNNNTNTNTINTNNTNTNNSILDVEEPEPEEKGSKEDSENKENVNFMNLSSNLDLLMPSASTNFSELPIKSSILRNKRKKSKKFLKKESPKFSKNIRVKKVKKYLKFKIQILHNKSEL